jgi:DNA-binding XRE family transcriptional regulator
MNNQLQNNFKSLRVRSGLIQEEVAKMLGISRQQYITYENNPNIIKIDILLKLSKIFKCDINEFFLNINITENYKQRE